MSASRAQLVSAIALTLLFTGVANAQEAETPPAETPPAETPPAEAPPAETPPAEAPPADSPPGESLSPGELRPPEGEPPALPPPTLGEPPEGEIPEAPQEPEGPVILQHIGTGEDPPLPPPPAVDDVPFEVPDDGRTATVGGSLPRPPPPPVDEDGVEIEPEPEPPFTIAVGAGWTRVDGVVPIDLVRTEVRFEARIPDLPELRLGAGAALMVGDALIFEGGPRVSLAQIFHVEQGTVFEITAAVQPGITAGALGVEFDLHAGLTLRARIDRVFEFGVSGAYSLVGTRSLFHATGLLALVF